MQLEPGGEFAHVAIRIGTRWLHAAPYAGVEFVSELAKIGSDFTILTNGRAQEIKLEEAGKYLGLRYDSSFDWSDTRSSYCSKLIANLLGIEPTPAHFAASHWRGVGLLRTEGAVGISPDEIFQILRKDGFQPRGVNTCEGIFHKAY
ncbi:MAG: hypothetical protein EOP06_02275 [Proteobacteria bacterium]|nr:MAG: hypothetical protein EOP06_02275 [Pseudomonadota bacterium]